MEKQATCKDRVGANYKARIEDIRQLWAAYGEDPEKQLPDLGNFNEYGLCFDYVAPGTFNGQRRGYFRYQLSWGGPGDEFRFYTDENFKPSRVEYWFLDWFDGAKRTIRSGTDWELLTEIFEDFRDCGIVESEYHKAIEE